MEVFDFLNLFGVLISSFRRDFDRVLWLLVSFFGFGRVREYVFKYVCRIMYFREVRGGWWFYGCLIY